MQSVRVEDILEVINADIIIMKIDIEGYECKVDIISLTLQYTSYRSDIFRRSNQRFC